MHSRFHTSRNSAFSLVELAIVLVVLGLITGGILAGQSLIRASELRAVSTEFTKYYAAFTEFKKQYRSLPGDMPNATKFWGQVATCPGTASTGTLTCNGDGNAQIISNNEPNWAWQQLAAAGLIEGTYAGAAGAGTAASPTSGPQQLPSSKYTKGLWYVGYWGTLSGDGSRFDGNYGHTFQFGAVTSNSTNWTALMKPEELWNIDKKLDDGIANTGSVVARRLACTTAASVSVTTAAQYDVSKSTAECVALFRNLF